MFAGGICCPESVTGPLPFFPIPKIPPEQRYGRYFVVGFRMGAYISFSAEFQSNQRASKQAIGAKLDVHGFWGSASSSVDTEKMRTESSVTIKKQARCVCCRGGSHSMLLSLREACRYTLRKSMRGCCSRACSCTGPALGSQTENNKKWHGLLRLLQSCMAFLGILTMNAPPFML